MDDYKLVVSLPVQRQGPVQIQMPLSRASTLQTSGSLFSISSEDIDDDDGYYSITYPIETRDGPHTIVLPDFSSL